MPKNKKEESTDSDSGPDDHPSKKKAKTSTAKDISEDGFELAKNRRVTVNEFKGKVYVGIREFYEKDGKQLPSKKGISLSVPQWEKLLEHKEAINKKIKEF